MAHYSIGDVAERCAINPVTLRAWQRRYGLLKPQRSEGGHRQFDEEDIQRIEDIKRWIKAAYQSVGEGIAGSKEVAVDDGWSVQQEEMMAVLRRVNPANLRAKIIEAGCEYPVDALIDHVYTPVRQRLNLDQNTARAMSSLLDGVLIEYAASCLSHSRTKAGKEALLIGWDTDDRTRLWLEAWRLSQRGWHIDVLAEPLDLPRPELFPGQHIFIWTGKTLTRRQQEQFEHWHEQGFTIVFHGK